MKTEEQDIEIEDVNDECYYLRELHKAETKIKRLQEQLKSANNTMKAMLPFSHNYPKERIEKYLKKWGVK